MSRTRCVPAEIRRKGLRFPGHTHIRIKYLIFHSNIRATFVGGGVDETRRRGFAVSQSSDKAVAFDFAQPLVVPILGSGLYFSFIRDFRENPILLPRQVSVEDVSLHYYKFKMKTMRFNWIFGEGFSRKLQNEKSRVHNFVRQVCGEIYRVAARENSFSYEHVCSISIFARCTRYMCISQILSWKMCSRQLLARETRNI